MKVLLNKTEENIDFTRAQLLQLKSNIGCILLSDGNGDSSSFSGTVVSSEINEIPVWNVGQYSKGWNQKEFQLLRNVEVVLKN